MDDEVDSVLTGHPLLIEKLRGRAFRLGEYPEEKLGAGRSRTTPTFGTRLDRARTAATVSSRRATTLGSSLIAGERTTFPTRTHLYGLPNFRASASQTTGGA